MLWMVAMAMATPALDAGPPEIADENAWIRLVNGEWLWGDFNRMRASTIEFDSDKMGNVTFPWRDVDAVWVPRSHEWKTRDGTVHVGTAVMDGDVLTIRTAEGDVQVPKMDINGITPGSGKELSYWGFYASVGLTAWWGNTRQLSLTSLATITREDARTRFELTGEANYGFNNNEQTAGRYRGSTQFDYNVTGIFYITPFIGEVYNDKFQNIGLRGVAGAGVALRQDVSGVFNWNVGAYGVYQYTAAVGDIGTAEDPHGGGIKIEAGYSWDITGDITWDTSWASTLIIDDFGQTNHRGRTAFDIDLTKILTLTPALIYERLEEPPQNVDGTIPKSNDLQVTVGLSLDI